MTKAKPTQSTTLIGQLEKEKEQIEKMYPSIVILVREFVQDKLERTITVLKSKSYADRINRLKELGIITDIYIYGDRPIVVVDINGQKQPMACMQVPLL